MTLHIPESTIIFQRIASFQSGMMLELLCARLFPNVFICYISCRVTIPGIFWIRRRRRRKRREKKSIKHYNAPLISRQITMLRRTISISRDSRLGCLTVAEETYLHTSLVCSVLSRWFYSSHFFTSHIENGKFHEFQTASDETTSDVTRAIIPR